MTGIGNGLSGISGLVKLFGGGSAFRGFQGLFSALDIFKAAGNSGIAIGALSKVSGLMKTFDGSQNAIIGVAQAMETLDESSVGAIAGLVGLDDVAIKGIAEFLGLDSAAISASAAVTASGAAAGGAAGGFSALGASIASAAKGLAAFLLTNPVGWAILATGAIVGLNVAIDNNRKKQEELSQQVSEITAKFNDQHNALLNGKSNFESLANEYVKLSHGVNTLGENTSLTSDEYDRYKEVVNEIATTLPNLIQGHDAEGNALLTVRDNVRELTDAYNELIVAENTELLSHGGDIFKDFKNYVSGYDVSWLTFDSFLSTKKKFNWKNLEFVRDFDYDALKGLESILTSPDLDGTVRALQNGVGDVLTSTFYDNSDLASIATKLDSQFERKKFENDADFVTRVVRENGQRVRAILNEEQKQIEEQTKSMDAYVSAYLSNAFLGNDYQRITSDSQNVLSQIIGGFDFDFYKDKLNDGQDGLDAYLDNILNVFNSNDSLNKGISSFIDIQTKFNGEDVSIGKYQRNADSIIETIDNLEGLDETAKEGIKLALGIDDKSVNDLQEKYNNALNNILQNDKYESVEDNPLYKKTKSWLDKLNKSDLQILASLEIDPNSLNLDEIEKILAEQQVKINSSLPKAIEGTASILANSGAVNEVLGKQSAGKSVSVNDLYHNENGDLSDYIDALEYVNGAYQLNIDKVKEITKAKADEQIAVNNVGKALAQEDYIDNANKISQLRKEIQKLSDPSYLKSVPSEKRNEIIALLEEKRNEIDSLSSENEFLSNNITQYNLLTASLKEATSAYQGWLDAQNGGDYGDMFTSSSSALQLIQNTNTSGKDEYGNYGSLKYKAALDLIVPDTIDKEDETAVDKYVQSLKRYYETKDGDFTGDLNLDNFFTDAIEKGLMNYDSASGDIKVAGEKTMEDFAEGLNLSLPIVQAIFDQLTLKGYEFDWADEAIQSLTDLAVKANESKEALSNITGIDAAKINIDVSGPETAEEKINSLKGTIEYLNNCKATLNLDTSQAAEVDSIISYCYELLGLLETPMVMKVDTSGLTGDIQEALSLLQEYQSAKDNLEKVKAKVGVDASEVSEAESAVATALSNIEGSSAFAKIGLKVDKTSEESLQGSVDTIISSLNSKDALIKLGVDDTLIKDYNVTVPDAEVIFTVKDEEVKAYQDQKVDKPGEVNWKNNTSEVDSYSKQTKYSSGTVRWGNDTSNVKTHFTATGTINWIGANKVNGTANAFGTARAGGNWGAKQGGTSLFGELGTEIIVDPNTGMWHTVGDHGAEFAYLPKGAIVFNHKQTESLLKYGHVAGRGKSYASGTAMVTGGGKWKKPGSTSSSSGATTKSTTTYRETKTTTETTESEVESTTTKTPSTKTTSASSRISKEITEDFHVDPIISDEELAEATGKKSSSSSTEKEPEKFDWIEVLIDRVERGIDRLSKTAESAFKKLSTRLASSKKEITDIGKEIDIQQKAYNRYMKEAEYVGLDEDLALMVRNGIIDIDEYDEETQKLINEYKEWHEKALDCSEAIDDLHESLAQLYQDNFDNVKTDYDNRLGLLEHSINTYQSGIDMIQQKGYLASAKYYESLADLQRQNISILQNELSDLTAQFQNAMASGEIEEYSEAWYGFQNEINGVKEAIADANTEMLTLADSMRDAEWGVFDYTSGMISRLNDEASFLIDLMSDYNLHEDNGTITDKGMATMGLRGMNYNVYMAQANRYGDEVKRLNKLLKDDPYNTNYISRREEVLKLQRDSIKAAQEQKVAITDLVKDGIDKELESLQDLIDKYEDSLDAAKNLNDYQEKISDQAKEVANLRKQLTAYSGDESEEGRARLQKIQTQLEQAEKELAKTEYDQYISDQKDMLNELYETYEETLNKRVDDIDRVLDEQTGVINANADQISDTINGFAESMGYTVTNEMGEIWNKNTIAASFDGVMAKYDKDYSTQLTSINTTLGFIDNWVRLATGNTEKTYDAIVDTDNMMIDPNAHQTLRSNGVKAYKGGGLVDYTGIAKVDGSASRPEMVLDSEDTRNFISLRNSLRNIASRPLTMSSIGISGGVPVGGIYDISDRLSAISAMTYNTGYTFGDFEINIPIDHVEDYNDLVRQLQKDKQFEEMVLDMTVNRVMGKSSLAKNKHKW